MTTIYLDPEKFQAKLNSVVRYWNDIEQEGQADNQASPELKNSCRYIFLRDDGWSIASPTYQDAYDLWPEDWAYCYVLQGQPQRSKSFTGTLANFRKAMDRPSSPHKYQEHKAREDKAYRQEGYNAEGCYFCGQDHPSDTCYFAD